MALVVSCGDYCACATTAYILCNEINCELDVSSGLKVNAVVSFFKLEQLVILPRSRPYETSGDL
jgi:hypothetical protein